MCCTKNTPDISPLEDIIAPAISPGHTVIVLIQNGLNIEKPFVARFSRNIVLSGVSRIDAHEISSGVIEHKQRDLLHIGAFPLQSHSDEKLQSAAQHFVDVYGAGGKTTCLYVPDVGYDRWTKLVYNATFNPISALVGINTGELQMTDALDMLVIPAMREVVKVAEAAGYKLPEGIVEDTIRSNPVEKRITPSMMVDTQRVSWHFLVGIGGYNGANRILGQLYRA